MRHRGAPAPYSTAKPPITTTPFSFASPWIQIRRRAIVERLVRASIIVKTEVAIQRRIQLGPTGEVAGVDELVLQGAPQSLDENIGLSCQLRLMQAV